MKKVAEKICKHKKVILIVSIILAFFSFIGMKLTKINYDILVYLPEDIETIKGQNILTDDFNMGSYSVAIIDNMSSKNIVELENKIKNVEGVNEVVSLYDVIGTSIPVEMLPNEVTSKLHKDNTDLILITFKDGTSNEKTINAVEEIRSITKDSCKLSGMSSMVLDTMNLSEQEIMIYIIIAVILCLTVLELSLDSYLAPVFLLLNIGCAILFNLGTNLFLGQISYITKALVAVLQLGVTTDFSIFLYHSYEDKKKKFKDKNEAMSEAIAETFVSVLGSSLTTVAGFLVLCAMKLTLGKDLGIVMAKGVILGVITVLTLFPSLLLIFDKAIEKTKHKSLNLNFTKFNKFIVNNHIIIFIVFLICLVPAYLGYKKVDVYYKIDKSLPDTLESISANAELKEKYNIVSPEMIIVDSKMKTNDIVNMVNELKAVDGVDFVLSFDELKQYGVTENMLPSKLLSTFKNDKYEMLLLNSTYEVASDELNSQIETINSIVKKYDENIIVAGEGPLMKDLINISDTDFTNVNSASIICVLAILLIVLKSLSLPFLLTLTIESAIIINMSFSYFGGVTLPFVAPIVLGTIQLGATIDYAILLTSSYLKNRKDNLKPKEAVLRTLNYNGKSVLISGLCFFAATFGVGVYSKLEMVGSLCTLISRGAIVSMLVVIMVLPSVLLIFDKLITKTTKGSKNMKNILKKVTASMLVITLLSTSFPVYALTKNETVYGKLGEDGKVKNVYVNEQLINSEKESTIEDYTDLKDILNINSNETFTIDNNKIVWNAEGNDILYQGKYENNLPIDVSIKYSLNGKKMNLDDMLGLSGKVSITVSYKNNDKHIVRVNGKSETLYTPFVVMFGTVLDNETNSNISVTNGKVTSNGTKSVIAALATPGLYESLNLQELKDMNQITISFDTTSFELKSMYSVVTPKLISNDDLKVFDKLDTLYKKADELGESMDLINNGSIKLKDGSNELKTTLKNSISALQKNNGDVLSDEQLNTIKSEATSTVKGKFTDEYKNSIATEAWSTVSGMLNPSSATAQSIGTEAVTKALTEYVNSLTDPALVQVAGGCIQGLIPASDSRCNEVNLIKKYASISASSAATSTAKIVSEEVAKRVSEQTAIKTAEELAPTLASKVANTVRDESLKTITTALNKLYGGVEELDNGINELNNGITRFNDEGIKVLTNLVNNNVKSMSEKVKALTKLGNEYKTVNSTNTIEDSETKLILVIDGKKKEVVENNTTVEVTKTTFWDRVKNLFTK